MTTSTDTSTPDSGTTTSQHQPQPIQKGFSCVLCAQRKVKCDKAPGGCGNCSRARVDCVYKAPPPPRRRKKGVRDVDVHARLRLYEDALMKAGIEPEELVKKAIKAKSKAARGFNADEENSDDSTGPTPDPSKPNWRKNKGLLISSSNGKSIYLENTLWTSLKGEFRDTEDLLLDDTTSEEEDENSIDPASPLAYPSLSSSDDGYILLGTPKVATNLRPLHPQPVQMFKLWQAYLDNVNPLLKLIHTPTVQQLISHTSGNLNNLPKNVEALLFSIYSMAVESLDDGECMAILGESKAIAGQRFKTATQYALVNASFLKTSDMMVLQALVQFNTALQNHDARIVWILTGVASRIGQRIGLHRDPETLGLPPFECEMRRRVWWQILMQDGFAEKLAGTGGSLIFSEVKRPSNVNDSQLVPGMKEFPKDQEGATEMMFFLIRCHVGELLRSLANKKSTFDGVWNKLSTNAASLELKDKVIDELEALYERRYLRYCDHSVPWHYLCTHLTKGIVSMLRFIAHSPEPLPSGAPMPLPPSESDKLFRLSIQITSYQNLCYTTPRLHGYLWHINSHFQWKGFIYMVHALRERTHGPDVDEAWKQVRLVYDLHPSFGDAFAKRALTIAVGNMTLRAWDAYVGARGEPEDGTPAFVKVLRAREARRTASASASEQKTPQPQQAVFALPAAQDGVYGASGDGAASSAAYQAEFAPLTLTAPAPTAVPPPLPPPLTNQPDPLATMNWNAGFAYSLDPLANLQLPEMQPWDAQQMDWAAWEPLLADFGAQGMNADVGTAGAGVGVGMGMDGLGGFQGDGGSGGTDARWGFGVQ